MREILQEIEKKIFSADAQCELIAKTLKDLEDCMNKRKDLLTEMKELCFDFEEILEKIEKNKGNK